jgi:hypothetical protein
LIDALDDPDRFAAAHVLLTEIEVGGGGLTGSGQGWNGLRVDLSPEGRVLFHEEQREELKAFWRKRVGGA